MSWRGVSDLNVEGNGRVRGVGRLVVYGAGGVLALIEQPLWVPGLVVI